MRRFISLLLSVLLLCTVLLPASLAETAEQPAEEAAEGTTEEAAKEAAEGTTEETAGETAEKAAGETAEEATAESAEKSAWDIFNNLLNSIGKRKANSNEISDPAAVDACCRELYGYVDPDAAERVFYGGPSAAVELLKILSVTLFSLDKYYDPALGNAEVFYVYVWAMFHSDPEIVAKLSPTKVKNEMKRFCSKLKNVSTEAVEAAADLCMNYIISHEPGIVKTSESK